MKYRVKFEFFGKRMQTIVDADSKEEAMNNIRNRVTFYSVEPEDETLKYIMDIFGFKQ